MNTRICAVCSKEKPDNEFGDGIKIPLTTCRECAEKSRARAKAEADKPFMDPIAEYVKELQEEMNE